ncbi:hypothetical protein R50072_17270 [Simiduia litorea]|uniref:Uncharacterized protein n=1 Tax=Simiduia curdlanivorans TaxID=1492769 RepID=A0ABV8V9S6_9GAMM|nr:hypothetical protein [Simiduia curdlanivorans]MDN3639682.1 hypothetical protein [Simiduia curdlanivorans]
MYVFSVMAKAVKARDGVSVGQQVPFIVYINFLDLFGAENLCKIYLMRAGFTEAVIENRKKLPLATVTDKRVLSADKALKDAVEAGYHIQMFDEA